jgi:hypothetical protein
MGTTAAAARTLLTWTTPLMRTSTPTPLLADLDPAALGGHHGTEQDPTFAADDHVA